MSKNKLGKYWTIFLFACLSLTCEEQVFDNPYDPAYKIDPVKTFAGEQVGEHIKLTWQKNEDVRTGFMIERKAPGDSDFSVLIDSLSPNITTYVDSFITTDKTYYYMIIGKSGENSSPYSETVLIETFFPKPTNLQATPISDTQIQLTWEDNSTFELGFRIERRSEEDVFTVIHESTKNQTTYIDTGLVYSTHYYYRIRGFTTKNMSDYSDTISLWLVKTFYKIFYVGNAYNSSSVCQTDDDGFIIAGYSSIDSNTDAWLIKTDEGGYEEWRHTFGGHDYDGFFSVQNTIDGGYIMTGYTRSYGEGDDDLWIIKTDFNGNEQWIKIIGGLSNDYGRSVKQTNDGEYIIVGNTSSYGSGDYDLWLIKINNMGEEEWTRTLGDQGNDIGYSVIQTNDGGYVVAGHTTSYGPGKIWLIKTDEYGNEEWNKTFGSGFGGEAHSVCQTNDGGYIITGYTKLSSNSNSDLLLLKTDALGNEEWSKAFGGSDVDVGYSVVISFDGDYVVTGHTRSYGEGGFDVWLIMINTDGNMVWSKTYGIENSTNSETAYSVYQTSDGGFIIAAISGYLWLIKTDPEGNVYE